MVDKNLFIETLHEVAEIARTSPQPLTKEEIRKYFDQMELSAEQEEMVYQYLKLPEEVRTAVPGAEDEERLSEKDTDDDIIEESGEDETQGQEDGETQGEIPVEKLSDSAYYRMYLDEVKGRAVSADSQQIALYEKLIAKDSSVIEQIVDNWLMRVIETAKFYRSSPVNMEDLIQEGNMALWMALGQIPDEMRAADMEVYLAEKVRTGMEDYIREVTGDADWMQTVLAKAALLHEAQELLAKENGQTPSMRQLSEYTHIPAEEIQDILALYKEKEQG